MFKVNVTPELADLIKMIRRDNNILSKDLAIHIEKSPAYISKLEKGDIKTIDEEELTNILNFIIQDKDNYDDLVESVIRTLSFKYSADEIDNQVWLYNYDTVNRMIPIPESMIDDLNKKIEENSISLIQLNDRINANEEIPKDINIDGLPINQWSYSEQDDEIYIRIRLDFDKLTGIMEKKVDKTNYVTMLSIVYYLNKMIMPDRTSNNDFNDIRRKSHEYLNSYKFYSLNERNKLLHQVKSKDEQNEILNSFDQNNIDIINDILKKFTIVSDMDIKKTNDQLKAFDKNLEWDLAFIMTLISSEFWKLVGVSYNHKKVLMNEIRDLINKYKSLPDDIKNIEAY